MISHQPRSVAYGQIPDPSISVNFINVWPHICKCAWSLINITITLPIRTLAMGVFSKFAAWCCALKSDKKKSEFEA